MMRWGFSLRVLYKLSTWILHWDVDLSAVGAPRRESGDGEVNDFQQISSRKRALSSKHLIHAAWKDINIHPNLSVFQDIWML